MVFVQFIGKIFIRDQWRLSMSNLGCQFRKNFSNIFSRNSSSSSSSLFIVQRWICLECWSIGDGLSLLGKWRFVHRCWNKERKCFSLQSINETNFCSIYTKTIIKSIISFLRLSDLIEWFHCFWWRILR